MRACIYWRCAHDGQSGNDAAVQIRACTEHAAARGWAIAGACGDPGRSERSVRHGFQQMMADLRAGRFDAVVVHRLDRCFRNMTGLTAFLSELAQYGVALVSVTEGTLDPTTGPSRLLLELRELLVQRCTGKQPSGPGKCNLSKGEGLTCP